MIPIFIKINGALINASNVDYIEQEVDRSILYLSGDKETRHILNGTTIETVEKLIDAKIREVAAMFSKDENVITGTPIEISIPKNLNQ